jgi:hypothetical protein
VKKKIFSLSGSMRNLDNYRLLLHISQEESKINYTAKNITTRKRKLSETDEVILMHESLTLNNFASIKKERFALVELVV